MTTTQTQTEILLQAAAAGNNSAVNSLLARHRDRLCRAMAARIEPRLAIRIGASDVVQGALVDAARKLTGFLRHRPIAFYPWLVRLASERLVKSRRMHLASIRDMRRDRALPICGGSTGDGLATQIADRHCEAPSHRICVEETKSQVHAALDRLPPLYRDVMILKYFEDLTFAEIAVRLGISESAAKLRHFRAVAKLEVHLNAD